MLTKHIMHQDNIEDNNGSLSFVEKPVVTPSPRKRQFSSSYLEVPLTPPTTFRRKRVKFSDIVTEIPLSILSKQDLISDNDLLEATLQPVTGRFYSQLKQEQLQEADTTLRVDVPIVDSVTKVLEKTSPNLLKDIKKSMGPFASVMWEVSKIKEMTKLQWKFVDQKDTHVIVEDKLSDEHINDTISTFVKINDYNQDVSTGDDVQQYFGFRADEDEEDLEPLPLVIKNDLTSLVKRQRYNLGSDKQQPVLAKKTLHSFERSRNLASFMRLYNQKCEIQDVQTPLIESVALVPGISQSSCLTESVPLVAPVIDCNNLPARSFMVTTFIMTNRKLYRYLRDCYKHALFVERDTSLVKSATKDDTEDIVQGISSTFNLEEADILVSPKVGIIVTSLQKVRQRALPGQAECSLLHDRIQKVSERYESLIVIIVSDTNVIGAADNHALARFMAFTEALEGVQALLVHDAGRQEQVAKWIFSILATQAFDLTLACGFQLYDKESVVSCHACELLILEQLMKETENLLVGTLPSTSWIECVCCAGRVV